MEEIIKETAKQVPALGVLAWLTWLFLKHLDTRDKALTELTAQLTVHHDKISAVSNAVINENTRTMAENTRAIDEMRRTLKA